MFRKGILFALCALMLCCTAHAAPDTSIEIKQGADKLKAALEAMPYAKTGQGAPLYVFQFTDCPYCQAFYSDFKGSISGIQLRHFFYAVSQKSANETAGLARNPRGNIYHMLMSQSTTAQPYDKNQKRLDAYNRVMEPLNDVIIPTLIQNGWPKQTLVSPTFIWEENGTWYADGGYRRDQFEKLATSIREANPSAVPQQTAKVIPSHARSIHAHDGAPMQTTDIQGVSIGMPLEEAQQILQQNGYTGSHTSWRQNDDQSSKVIALGVGQYTENGKTDKPFVSLIRYERKYKDEVVFPTEALKDAVLKKYGPPLNDVVKDPNFGGYTMQYYPPNPDRKIIENNCLNEMNIKGKEPYKEGYSTLHPMTKKVWQEQGFRVVRDKCPDQMEDYKKLLAYEFGTLGSVAISPREKLFVIEAKQYGPEAWKWRWLKEERLQQKDSGPVGTVDL